MKKAELVELQVYELEVKGSTFVTTSEEILQLHLLGYAFTTSHELGLDGHFGWKLVLCNA